MNKITKRVIFIGLTIVICCSNIALISTTKVDSFEPFFTLTAKSYGGGVRPDYLNLLRDNLRRINIELDIQLLGWWDFFGYPYWGADIFYVSLSGSGGDPDFTGVYNENGSLNLFGYHTSMDWDDCLGGINEWYMRQGTQIMPPDSEERIQHYWEWEDYLMDKICPMLPTFTMKSYMAQWSNLEGYNYAKGILQSWGQMDWIGSHMGQVSTDELVISDGAWSDHNPLYQDDSASAFISGAIMDPLIWFDNDLSVWPHLAESYEMLNDTHLRIKVREDIKWQLDPDGLYPNEYLDAQDVYFTFYCWKEVSNDRQKYAWIDSMKIIDQYIIDIFIDGDPSTQAKEVHAPFLSCLNTEILPEHYLNQSQMADNVTPDISDAFWNTFATHGFGTGLFEISQIDEGSETILSLYPECWRLHPVITADPALNWTERFGFGTGWDGMHQLRIKIINHQINSIKEFEKGNIDLADISLFPEKIDVIEEHPEWEMQSDTKYYMGFFGYNMREVRPYIGSREPCPNDPNMTIGLAIRKAISYATNRVEMNNIVHGGDFVIVDWPIYSKMDVWCNPDIIRYNYDLEKAKEYLFKAGFNSGWISPISLPIGFLIGGIIFVFTTTIWLKRRSKRKEIN
ncbi:MAG: hypothetical protein KGD59_11675 [Candidatus Heimdallarchaeota archaeon]|nr:hypothetical protein [Candidatus Heimdallarchaeota archaeon]MBY8995203.1 hypothetical protein [Candidatus Heimdallarchaeota archaeon]